MIKSWQLLLLVLLVAGILSACHKHSGLQIGDVAPTATLTGLDGKPVTLPDDLKGKVVLVRFWSLDCEFCDKEVLLSLESFYQKYKDKGFLPVAINESRIDAADKRLTKFKHLTYPMLVDDYGLVAKKFGVIGLPTTFVFDEKGILRDKITGEAGAEEFEKLFTTILYKGGFYENGY